MNTQNRTFGMHMLAFCLMGLVLAGCGARLNKLDKQIAEEILDCPTPPPPCPPDTLYNMSVMKNGQLKTYVMEVTTIRNPDNTLITHTRKIRPAQLGNLPMHQGELDRNLFLEVLDVKCPAPPCPPDTKYVSLVKERIYTVEAITTMNPNDSVFTHILKIKFGQ